MRMPKGLLLFIVGSVAGVAASSYYWYGQVATASEQSVQKAQRFIMLNRFAIDAIAMLGEQGKVARDTSSYRQARLLTDIYFIAKYYDDNPENESRIPYDRHCAYIRMLYDLESADEFASVQWLPSATVFADLDNEGEISAERVRLVVRMLEANWQSSEEYVEQVDSEGTQ